jgi:KR domain
MAATHTQMDRPARAQQKVYEVSWKAASVALSSVPCSSRSGAAPHAASARPVAACCIMQDQTSGIVYGINGINGIVGKAGHSRALARDLQLLQAVLSAPANADRGVVCAHATGAAASATATPVPQARTKAFCLPGAAALLRVAAQESETGFVELDAAAADPMRLPWQACSEGDAFGASSTAGAWYRPVLTAAAAAGAGREGLAGSLGCSEQIFSGSVVVAGGLGDLGLMTGAWAAGGGGTEGRHVALLGRAGHAGSCPSGVGAGTNAVVSATRCDVACTAEVDALWADARRRQHQPAVRAIVHAGGVLQACADGTMVALCSSVCLLTPCSPCLLSPLPMSPPKEASMQHKTSCLPT